MRKKREWSQKKYVHIREVLGQKGLKKSVHVQNKEVFILEGGISRKNRFVGLRDCSYLEVFITEGSTSFRSLNQQ
jgi:hypothetical protein